MLNPALERDRPQVSIVVVNFNTRDLLDSCIRSVKEREKRTSYEIIVVDNASTDGSVEMLQTTHPDVVLIALQDNTGFAIANNIAAKCARGDYLLLLNTDAFLLDDSIARLVDFAKEHPAAGLWGGRTLYADGRLNPTSCFRKYTPWNILCRATGVSHLFPSSPWLNSTLYGNWKRDRVRAVDVLAGCFLLISRSTWDRLGGFDVDFFLYGEDVDFCIRARKLGCRPLFTPASEVVHLGEGSQPERAEKLVHFFTGMRRVVKKHFSPPARAVADATILLWPLTRIAAYGLLAIPLNERYGPKCRLWQSVWRSRGLWYTGVFPELGRLRRYAHAAR